jgi:glyoxylase-like metal-dependent hydrolase (beta-lactamase superfamily II)
MEDNAEDFYNSIKQFLENKTIYIINTHFHHDHVDGNYLFNAEKIYIPDYSEDTWNLNTNTENHFSKLPYEKVKEEIIITDNTTVVKIIPAGNGHTFNDLVVYVETENIMFTGDLFFHDYHPYLYKESGANAENWMNLIFQITGQYNMQTVVPGHGQIADKEEWIEQADYFQDIINNRNSPIELFKIRKKYKHYANLPKKSSFKKTVDFIKDEFQ